MTRALRPYKHRGQVDIATRFNENRYYTNTHISKPPLLLLLSPPPPSSLFRWCSVAYKKEGKSDELVIHLEIVIRIGVPRKLSSVFVNVFVVQCSHLKLIDIGMWICGFVLTRIRN